MTSRFCRPTFVAIAVLAAVTLAATACSRPATTAASGNGPIRISVGVDPSYAPFFLADREGLFKAAGLDVQIVQTEGGAAGAQNVVAGTSEMSGNADSTALTVMAANPTLRALGVYEDSQRYFQVVLRPGVTPQSIKTMGVFPGISLYFTDIYLRSLGIDPANTKLVNTGPPEQPALLARGDIDGFISFDPWIAQAVGTGGKVVATSGDFGAQYSQWLLASQSWLATHEDTAARVFRVVADAAAIVQPDPDRAAKAVSASIQMDPAAAKRTVTQINFGARDFTDDDITRADSLVKFFRGQNKISGPVDTGTGILRGWVTKHVAGPPA
ncbi:ABC transporter substrate-binding protein [Amycolatopsis sp.]|jgi:NitT/TauT family transport system substrate-binding protein|uniref:ABC transporter substrate-binding protein n=1 Tax=Amycolatopsis sp. TaxID=37632 RepID=UPI002E08A008|nr:ABC transporter substrate-binding protein [Amycolatopsis sp.]